MKKIHINLLNVSQVLRKMNESPRLGMGRVVPLLELLTQSGFTWVRFYEVAFDVVLNDRLLILSSIAGKKEDTLIGKRIPYKDSTQARSDSKYFPAVDCGFEGEKSAGEKQWIRELGLQKECWVDIPLLVNNEFLGLIACSWDGIKADLSKDDLSLLSLIGSQAANFLVPDVQKLEAIRNKISDIADKSDTVLDVARHGCVEICNNLRVAIGTIYEYSWLTGELVKVDEYIDQSLKRNIQDLNEIYPIGRYLAGRAWINKKYMHIVNFESVLESESKESLIEPIAHERSINILGKISSVLYAQIGNNEKQYLISIMNRCPNMRCHLVDRHRRIFEILCSELSSVIDKATANRRIRKLQSVARNMVQEAGLSTIIFEQVAESLKDEMIHNFAIFAHSKSGKHFIYRKFHGPLFYDVKIPENELWQDNIFYTKIMNSKEASVIKTSSFVNDLSDNHYMQILHKKGVIKYLSFPFDLKDISGALIIPVIKNVNSAAVIGIKSLRKEFPSRVELLEALTNMIANCIEAGESLITANNAQNFIGHIGHEFAMPISIVMQNSDAIYYTMLSSAKKYGFLDKIKADLDKHQENIINARRIIRSNMQIATIIAQLNKGRFQLNFRPTVLPSLLRNVRDMLREEMSFSDQQGIHREIRLDMKQSCDRLPTNIICDPDMLVSVFINLFRNAMKYSVPPGQHKPIEVIVEGNPQINWSIIRITNWGIGIPKEDYERIFEPFYRAEYVDRKKSVRGMGLGLYIARLIMNAHNGEVFCASSESTFGDIQRKRDYPYEGFLNTFEVRIPLNLQPGVRIYSWV